MSVLRQIRRDCSEEPAGAENDCQRPEHERPAKAATHVLVRDHDTLLGVRVGDPLLDADTTVD